MLTKRIPIVDVARIWVPATVSLGRKGHWTGTGVNQVSESGTGAYNFSMSLPHALFS